MDWLQLKTDGWEKKQYVSGGIKRCFYLTPPENGLSRKIKSPADLNEGEKHLESVLFSSQNKRISEPDVVIPVPDSSKSVKKSDVFKIDSQESVSDEGINIPASIEYAVNCLSKDTNS